MKGWHWRLISTNMPIDIERIDFNDFRIYLRVNGSCNTIQLKQIKEYFNIYGNTRDVIITFGAAGRNILVRCGIDRCA